MKYAVFTTRAAGVAFEAQAQAHLVATRPGYSAERWADLIAHQDGTKWAVPIPPELAYTGEAVDTLDGWAKPEATE